MESPVSLAAAFEAAVGDVRGDVGPGRMDGPVGNATKLLPPGAVAAYVECRATADEGRRVDLLACYLDREPLGSAQDPSDPCWELADAVQAARRLPTSALHRHSPLLWLEFDDLNGHRALPPPSVCVCMERGYAAAPVSGTGDRTAYRAILGELAPMALWPSRVIDTIARSIKALPEGAHAIHLSAMGSRPGSPAKLYLRLPIGRVRDYLARIGWQGDAPLLDDVIEWRRDADAHMHLDLTMAADGVAPRLGIAFPRDTDGEKFSTPIYEKLASYASGSSIRSDLAEAAARWAETDPVWRPAQGWPWVLHRWIDQKLVFDGHRVELKLYFALRPLVFLFGAIAGR